MLCRKLTAVVYLMSGGNRLLQKTGTIQCAHIRQWYRILQRFFPTYARDFKLTMQGRYCGSARWDTIAYGKSGLFN